MADPAQDQDTAWPSSPASPQLVRQLMLESLQTEGDKERYAAAHDDSRYLLPEQIVDEHMMTPGGLALSREMVDYLEVPTPFGQELLCRLEVHDGRLCRTYVAYLAALRQRPPGGRGLPAREMEALASALGRSQRSLRRDVQRAEEIVVNLVHAGHVLQMERRRRARPPGDT